MRWSRRNIKMLAVPAAVLFVLVFYGGSVLFSGGGSTPDTPTATVTETPMPTEFTSTDSVPEGTEVVQAPGGDMMAKLAGLTVAEAGGVNYERGEWSHWDNITPCWTVREQVLADEAVQDGTLTLLDKNKVRTDSVANACYVVGGTWVDVYTGETFTNPEDLDIDHMIPLNYAAKHGGQAWDKARKGEYANSRVYANHLIAVSASANRSKSDKGPSEWKPSNTAYHCQYATDWVNISADWGLTVSTADRDALLGMLTTCK